MSLSYRTIVVRLLIGLVLSALAFSCKQYEYASPLPGILEVRLRVINNRQDIMPFSTLNLFRMKLVELNALEPGDLKQPIFSDLHAIKRNPDGDMINLLDTVAAGGNLLLGATYAPPATFSNIQIRLSGFDPAILITNPTFGFVNQLPVNDPPPPAPATPTFFQVPDGSTNIQVNEGKLTVVTVSFNLDSVLFRRSEDFYIYPAFEILSVQNF